MAERLKEYSFRERGGSKYSWDEWTDGEVWKVKEGEDFECPARNFQAGLFNQAKRKGLKVRSNREEDVVVFQFYEKEDYED